ncbi:MAG: zinc ribbon-containing protein [Candidatus Marinimicrobia bacterium]|nr:zinc ribbon-containing protein [Candidatus Neomarinimicrobiota bacterium]MCF7828032.1 zinc ribbon-containing protein [Candidatus Neomarinimicrobiota bacterium]MCF7879213.1 zinc ribbon-containing protein [Candidatus Neomarinimicrobiota bacterium]
MTAQSEHTKSQEEERVANAYDRILENVRNILTTTSDITKKEFDRALNQAGTSLEEASQYTKDEIEKARKAVRKDWQNFVKVAGKQKEDFLESEQFQRISDTGLGMLAKMTKAVKNWATFLDEKIDEQITYHTGEVAGAGTFKCVECEKTMTFKKSGRIPPCSSCKSTTFRRML